MWLHDINAPGQSSHSVSQFLIQEGQGVPVDYQYKICYSACHKSSIDFQGSNGSQAFVFCFTFDKNFSNTTCGMQQGQMNVWMYASFQTSKWQASCLRLSYLIFSRLVIHGLGKLAHTLSTSQPKMPAWLFCQPMQFYICTKCFFKNKSRNKQAHFPLRRCC